MRLCNASSFLQDDNQHFEIYINKDKIMFFILYVNKSTLLRHYHMTMQIHLVFNIINR